MRTLYLGIDPAAKSGVFGIVWDDVTEARVLVHGFSADSAAWPWSKYLRAFPPVDQVIAVIEKAGSAKLPRFRDHVRHGREWAAAIRKAYPRRNQIEFVSPATWRKVVFGELPAKGTAKQAAIDFSRHRIEDIDVAEAYCLCYYAIGVEPKTVRNPN